jgi:cell division protein FtsI (penicillin-binding protein 3)
VIHKPNKKLGYYGNIVAAPVFERIARKIYTETPEVEEIDFASKLDLVDEQYDAYFNKMNSEHSKVPDVRNMAGMDAVALLENLGFNVIANGIGKVKSQSLKAGTEIKKGETIKLDLS